MDSALAVRDMQQIPATLEERKKQTDLTIETATYWAKRLMQLVEQCNLAKNVGGKKYLEVEGWQVIGEFAHVTPVIEWTRAWKDDGGAIIGYEARAKLINQNGDDIGAGESSCGFDAFPCRGKQGSEVDKAARSAAQTWAISRALRNKFSFVAKIAGYEPTPAEEMHGNDNRYMGENRAAAPAKKPSPIPTHNYVQHLGAAIMDFTGNDKKAATEILKGLTGKDTLKDLDQTTAAAAQLRFEKEYLSVTGDQREPGSDDA